MNPDAFTPLSEYAWQLDKAKGMRTAAVIYAQRKLLEAMEQDVAKQIANVAGLPGITGAAYAMPDAHSGYGFPIGGVAAFDPKKNGVVSAGGVGFDIACGVRVLHTGLHIEDLRPQAEQLADRLFARIPAGVGKGGDISLSDAELDAMLLGGASWAVGRGWGRPDDLARVEEKGKAAGAVPDFVSKQAKKRMKNDMGSLGSGNHYLEIQEVTEIFDGKAADAFGLREGDVLVALHCGSRGLGHQVATDFMQRMVEAAPGFGITLPDKELACSPLMSEPGLEYLGAMRAAQNCAMANRQTLTQLVRETFAEVLPTADLPVLCDISHNLCSDEEFVIAGRKKRLFVHRKGTTRALPPLSPELPHEYRKVGGPVPIGGSMGSASYILAGMEGNAERSFSSAPHGAGRAMSRAQAKKKFRGDKIVGDLAGKGVLVRAQGLKGVAEEAPLAYKDVDLVAETAEKTGLARRVAKLRPVICVKG
jgi:tRNA-splicing ligase RtcB